MLSSGIWNLFPGIRRQRRERSQRGPVAVRSRLRLLRLFQHQHRLLLEAFYLGWVALLSVLLTAIALVGWGVQHSLWLFYLPLVLLLPLAVVLLRFCWQVRRYLHNWDRHWISRKDGSDFSPAEFIQAADIKEKALLTAFRRKGSSQRWDLLSCSRCGRTVDMAASSCTYCGQEQKLYLHN